MDIRKKSFGQLLDELIVTNLKEWHIQDDVESGKLSDAELAEQFRRIQSLNVRRNLLINALDEVVDSDSFSTMKKNYK